MHIFLLKKSIAIAMLLFSLLFFQEENSFMLPLSELLNNGNVIEKAIDSENTPDKEQSKDKTSNKADTKKADTEKADTKKADTEKADTEKADMEKAETEKSETEKSETEKSETEESETEKSETEESETENAETEKAGTSSVDNITNGKLINRSENDREKTFNTAVYIGKTELYTGESESSVVAKLGKPQRIDNSEYGFKWYTYKKDYNYYLQVGIDKAEVVAFYSNSRYYRIADFIGVGYKKSDVRSRLGTPVGYIIKGKVRYIYNTNNERDIFLINGYYYTVFYDILDENRVTSVQMIKKETELALQGFYGLPSVNLEKSYESITFDLVNSIRVRKGKKPLKWDEKMSTIAKKHSYDMIQRNYFNHNNPDGMTPFDRIRINGIKFKSAAENIAAGQTSALFAHESLMNSKRHRSNVLGDFLYMGAGVDFGGKNHVYYTHMFYN